LKSLVEVIVLLLSTVVVSSCVPPVPLVHVHHQTGQLQHTQELIEQLVAESANHERVVKILGMPISYKRDALSYIACGRPRHVEIFWSPYEEANEFPQSRCFEFVIAFDNDDRVTSYRRTLTSGVVSPDMEKERARNLRERADQGDMTAKELYEQTLAYRLKQGDPVALYQMYYRDPIRQHRLISLCRAADSEYAPALAEVGRIYRWGLLDIKQDYLKAYQWYSRANKQDPSSWKSELNDARNMATSKQPIADTTQVALISGQCEKDLLAAITEKDE